ncbi:MAG: cysteine--tRNA ligase [Bacilli bacterium]|nr:cysteine--tRNA ligase [Bacilli bacterium]
MNLKLYNSLTRKKEDFESIVPDCVGMYVCGPTVYGMPHLGHARSYVTFDCLRRYFEYSGYKVKYVQNITDVGHLVGDVDDGEDKIQKQARLEQIDPVAIAYKYENIYFEAMDKLNVKRPTISCRATGHIIEIIDMIQKLLDKGYAYKTEQGNVYFDIHKFKNYGIMSGRSLDETLSGQRINIAGDKKCNEDFALWKCADNGHIMRWPSPFGLGYPGWHIECSVMAKKYLGDTFDIHGGGIDNMFPHHECEIAQSTLANGNSFARFFVHNNLVTINGQKMGKSLGNSIDLQTLLSKYNPDVLRLYLLQNHYRSVLDFTDFGLEETQKTYNKFLAFIKQTKDISQDNLNMEYSDITELKEKFLEAMDDDLNTALALSYLLQMLKIGNSTDNNKKKSYIKNVLVDLLENIFGLRLEVNTSNSKEDEVINILIKLRDKFKKDGNYEMSDFIRNELKNIGITLNDSREGTTYKIEQ